MLALALHDRPLGTFAFTEVFPDFDFFRAMLLIPFRPQSFSPDWCVPSAELFDPLLGEYFPLGVMFSAQPGLFRNVLLDPISILLSPEKVDLSAPHLRCLRLVVGHAFFARSADKLPRQMRRP